jgi:hypothetical protein
MRAHSLNALFGSLGGGCDHAPSRVLRGAVLRVDWKVHKVIYPIVQAMQAQLILAEHEVLISAACEAALDPRADPVVFLLYR